MSKDTLHGWPGVSLANRVPLLPARFDRLLGASAGLGVNQYGAAKASDPVAGGVHWGKAYGPVRPTPPNASREPERPWPGCGRRRKRRGRHAPHCGGGVIATIAAAGSGSGAGSAWPTFPAGA